MPTFKQLHLMVCLILHHVVPNGVLSLVVIQFKFCSAICNLLNTELFVGSCRSKPYRKKRVRVANDINRRLVHLSASSHDFGNAHRSPSEPGSERDKGRIRTCLYIYC